jgi:hypothetical protein
VKSHPLRYTIIFAIILLLGFGHTTTIGAQDQGGNVFIEYPTNGATVVGLITVTGAVAFPDFLKYEIFLKPDKGDLLWVATTYAPVSNGNLARFDTRTYMNGTYQMIIRQVHEDSNYTEAAGPTITIDNELGAPLPYPEIEPSYLYPTENYALVRLKNCSGTSLEFDYNSPQSSRSSDTMWLMAKGQDTTYCPFEDFVVIPGEYRGTATGQGEKAFNYSFQAEVGRVYELIYNGEGAAHNQFLINYVQGDKRASTDTGGPQTGFEEVAAAPTQTPVPVAAAIAPASAAPAQISSEGAPAVEAPPVIQVDSSSVLPETGQADATRLLFVLFAITLVLILIGCGVLVLIWRRVLSS